MNANRSGNPDGGPDPTKEIRGVMAALVQGAGGGGGGGAGEDGTNGWCWFSR